MKSLYIKSVLRIQGNTVWLNGDCVFKENDTAITMNDFFRNAFAFLNTSYPKFYKMDELSKLVFIGGELLSRSFSKEIPHDQISVLLMNKSSSLHTDRKHQASIDDANQYFPSPAIFVYTLPNIAIGELCIRHQIKGENYFFVQESLDSGFLADYTSLLFEANTSSSCICGWAELSEDGYDLFLYLVEQNMENAVISAEKKPIFASALDSGLIRENDHILHHAKNIERLYKLNN